MLSAVEAAETLTVSQIAAFAFAAAGFLLSILFVYHILVRGGSTASSLLWMAVILIAPWLGLLLYYLLPRSIQLRKLRRIRKRTARARQGRATGAEFIGEAAGLTALLDDDGGLCRGNQVRWLAGGEEFFAAAEAAIAAAEHQVHCVVYILRR
ncbi:MAG: PLDc N-terminal domain-containing protein, partial [Planctomycetes bacterium]|nr:PLDc N-terminal domain-containing protein [Planctomycetota bacterium]